MIRLGICTDISNIAIVERCGYEYLETGLAKLAAMPEAEYEHAVKLADAAGIRVEACNGMLPAEVRVTGPDVSAQKIHDYLELAFARARRLGCEIVVFGSAGARNVPEGFEIDVAWRQIGNFLRIAQVHAQDFGITVVIEPLNRGESNIINLVSEAVLIASLMQLKNVKALGDTYHMAMCSEPFTALTQAGHMLAHVHTANALGRVLPKEGDGENYVGMFEALRAGKYDARVSCEAGFQEFNRDARAAFEVLDKARRA